MRKDIQRYNFFFSSYDQTKLLSKFLYLLCIFFFFFTQPMAPAQLLYLFPSLKIQFVPQLFWFQLYSLYHSFFWFQLSLIRINLLQIVDMWFHCKIEADKFVAQKGQIEPLILKFPDNSSNTYAAYNFIKLLFWGFIFFLRCLPQPEISLKNTAKVVQIFPRNWKDVLNSRRISKVLTEFEISPEMIASIDEMVGGFVFLFTV